MTIQIQDGPEPMSERSLPGPGQRAPLLMESEGSRLLGREMRRYCEGQITGRSFLIAGHRGAGKSTMVAKTFLDTLRESPGTSLRPVLIALHGPSLFPVVEDKGNDPAIAQKNEAQIALEQIILGLHRAVAKEFAAAFYERVRDLVALRRERAIDRVTKESERRRLEQLLHMLPSDRELFELAGQFELELADGPDPRRLYQMFQNIRSVSGGVLFSEGYSPHLRSSSERLPGLPRGLRPSLPEVKEQGARELVALSGIIEAHRRISGDYKLTDQQKDQVSQQNERSSGVSDLQQLASPFTSLLTGGLTGTGLAVSGATPTATFLSGVGAALAASLVFKVSSTQKRDRSASREVQFIHDLSVATLDRVLPILIGRLRRAGLAPVFVVDELDKVNGLNDRILSMVHHLKKLVAETAFFCFLTDRSYFEDVLAGSVREAYPVEHTYYTHRLFVVYSAEDFERYLRLRIPDPPAGSGPDPDASARAVLRFVLRHRAQLHTVDVERHIEAIRTSNSEVRLGSDQILSSLQMLIDLTFQAAIEQHLAREEVQSVVVDCPEFGRVLNDAMYYLSRCWIEGKEEVDLSEQGRAAFETYIEHRAGRDGPAKDSAHAANPLIMKKDVEYLFEQVQRLAELLSDPRPPGSLPAFVQTFPAWQALREKRGLPRVESTVQDAVLVSPQNSVLVRTDGGRYRFRYRVLGGARPGPAVHAGAAKEIGLRAEADQGAPWEEGVAFIETFAEGLALAQEVRPRAFVEGAVDLGSLQSSFAVVVPTPAWSAVQSAMARLKQREGKISAGSEDAFVVAHFRDLLSRNALRIAQAMWCGMVVGAGSQGGIHQRVAEGLKHISAAYGFQNKSEREVGESLDVVAGQILRSLDFPFEFEATELRSLNDVQQFNTRLQRLMISGRPDPRIVNTVAERAEDEFERRVLSWCAEGNAGTPELSELLAAAAGRAPFALLRTYDPAEVSAADWIALIELVSKEEAALWYLPVAMHALGIRDVDAQNFKELTLRYAAFFRLTPPEPAELDHMRSVMERGRLLQGPAPAHTLVVVRRAEQSAMTRLRPTPETALLVVTATQFFRIADVVRQLSAPLPSLLRQVSQQIIALEMNQDVASFGERLIPRLREFLQDPLCVYVYPQDRGREMREPFVVAPQSPEDILRAALRTPTLL